MRHEDLYLTDALEAIRELREYLGGASQQEFLRDRFQQSFVFHRLVILGEACVALAKTYRERYPEVPWGRLSGMRNRMVHAFLIWV